MIYLSSFRFLLYLLQRRHVRVRPFVPGKDAPLESRAGGQIALSGPADRHHIRAGRRDRRARGHEAPRGGTEFSRQVRTIHCRLMIIDTLSRCFELVIAVWVM